MFCIGKRKNYYTSDIKCLIHGVPEISGQFRYAETDFPSQKDVLVAATHVDLKIEAITVRVLNLKIKPNIVDKGDVIATCEPVVDIFAHPREYSEAQLPSILENLEYLMKNSEEQ
ncbi:hypothetical protein AVEN_156535-1 [Araneus ventricosus]|uniref:Uncharacterized protein n=1 Tax=Araneus ventricosus TaxID=182803 RepID=A0A4Y2TJF9_ARAVE|nr:hypothetical protein AVEN_156535-1 [Araneus ventricosus]